MKGDYAGKTKRQITFSKKGIMRETRGKEKKKGSPTLFS